MVVYWSDDFEDCDITDWATAQGGAGSVTCSNARAKTGSWSMRIYSPAAADHAYARHTVPAVPAVYHAHVGVYIEGSIHPEGFYVDHVKTAAGRNFLLEVDFHDGACWLKRYVLVGPTIDICQISMDVWNNIDIYVNRTTGKYRVYLNKIFRGEFNCPHSDAPTHFGYVGDTAIGGRYGFVFLDDPILDDAPEPGPAGGGVMATLMSTQRLIGALRRPIPWRNRFPRLTPLQI